MMVDAPLFGVAGKVAQPIGKAAGWITGKVATPVVGGALSNAIGKRAYTWTTQAMEKMTGKTMMSNAERLAVATPAGQAVVNVLSGIAQRSAGGAVIHSSCQLFAAY